VSSVMWKEVQVEQRDSTWIVLDRECNFCCFSAGISRSQLKAGGVETIKSQLS